MERPIVVVSAPIYPEAQALLDERCNVRIWDRTAGDREALFAMLPDAQALFCTSEFRIDDAFLDRAPKLRIVATASVGYEHIDVEACATRGILVGNTPGVLVETTADLTFALVRGGMRRIAEGWDWIRAGKWSGKQQIPFGTDLGGKTMGIVGMGAIGSAVARRARASTMLVAYHNRRPRDDDDATGARYLAFDDVLRESDVVVVTVPLSPQTRKLFGREQFAMMKPSAYFVNIARGGIVDTDALVEALREKRIAGAALDVTDPEPLPADHPLVGLPNVLITPHVGSATRETRGAMSVLTAYNILAALDGKALPAEVCA